MSLPLILASSSPYRQALLAKLHMPFSVYSPNIDEVPYAHESPSMLVQRLAESKAKTVAKQHPRHLIIGSDQVLSLQNRILGKPETVANAVAQLEQMSGQQVRFYTGLCLLNSETGELKSLVETYDVTFKTLTQAQIQRYIALDNPLDCAGSFKSEGLGITLFSQLAGRDPNTLIGLPLIALTELLTQMGQDPLSGNTVV